MADKENNSTRDTTDEGNSIFTGEEKSRNIYNFIKLLSEWSTGVSGQCPLSPNIYDVKGKQNDDTD